MARARIHLHIGGKKRFLKFTISTMKRYDEKKGKDGAALALVMGNMMVALLELTEEALSYPDNENKLPEDFSNEMVSDWIDDLNKVDLEKLVKVMMESLKKFAAVFSDQTEIMAKNPSKKA